MGYIWRPPREVVSNANVTSFMEKHGFKSYKELVEASTRDIKWFWGNLPEWIGVEWFKEPQEVVDLSKGPEWAKWYIGGKLNAAYNTVDLPVKRYGASKEAFTWVGEDGAEKRVTYGELRDTVWRFAAYLKEIGVGKGDVVAIYAPMIPESITAMLAALEIGAIASPIFSGFAPSAVAQRLADSEAKVMVTVDGYYRKGRKIVLKHNADEARKLAGYPSKVVVIKRLGVDIPWDDDVDEWWDDALSGKRPVAEPEEMEAEDPALLLYTSGTTGKPKGAVISHAGTLLQPSKEHYFNLDMKPGSSDRLWWITDLGWMMGPWQVFGAQFHGVSHLIVEGGIDYPSRDRVWMLIEKYKVTHFGFAATVARMLRSYGTEEVEKHDVSSLRAFGNTGEPIDPQTWLWIVRDVGQEKRPMINLSGGTEIFGCFVLPSPVVPLKPSTLWGPGLGMDVDVVNDEGKPVRGTPGYLVAKKPAPSMTRGLWRDPQRYIETYWSRFPGMWYHGDLALIDEDGYWFILGRADDVIKVAGKRIGPAEIEAIINRYPKVKETACVGVPDPVKGEAIVCLVTPKPGEEITSSDEAEIKGLVARELGKPFTPSRIFPVDDLPRTRSGKIMRRIIRAIARGMEVQASPVMENPESLEYVRRVFKELMKSG
ncbi:MAG: AMP-binding protein [Desulfurococcales archaeon]|nr:AMP-binding protein [Desulfurococcales archaeon]